ncbi:putative mitochondrial-processing peptidase subunit beta, mitochondrial [Silene latifolia]|uniref:putative mitochondrial-processing peptidase subunit beta, mitochondrial n=1 Tax=Silene latifolia TaxID=37657 RepID=UPI003D7836F4
MSTRLLTRRTRHFLQSTTRHHATLTPTTTPTLAPPLMIYDRISDSVKSKLRRLNDPDPRFLRRASPHPTTSDHTHLLQFPATKLTVLPNGLRVASESSLSSRTASVSVLLDSGSRFDDDHSSGVAYFFHHLVLGSVPVDAADVGAHLDGFTHRESTWFSAQLSADRLPKGVEFLGRILQDLDLSDEMIAKLRDVILKEKEKVDADGENVILDQLHATAFQYTPLGRTIHGPVNNIRSITKADIQNYILSHCAAHRMVISACGAVKHEELVEQVKKVFTKLSANPTTTSQLVASDPVNFTGSEVRIIDDDLPLARFAVAFEGTSSKDPDSIALMVMQTMLGSWSKTDGAGKHTGSQLVQRVAINEIAESIKTFNISYKDTGLFGIYAVAKPDCLDDLSYGIMHEISKLSYRVSDDDVIRARNQLKSHLLLQSNEIGAVSEEIGRQLLSYGRRIPFAELFARIDAVDASTVKRVANRFLFDKDIAIAAMGPIKGLPDYNWFRRRTYWLRY